MRLNLSPKTEIVDTIVSWDFPKLSERPTLVELTGKAAPEMQAEGHRLIIRMDAQAAKQLFNHLRSLI
jgi:hypothetical protein